MERAHLILNPEARAVTPALARVIRSALESHYKLEYTFTRARDSGTGVARQAAEDGASVVIAFGGDGLVNEVVNGLVGHHVDLGIIPGGTMNVLARNLGIPTDPLSAADRILGSGSNPRARVKLATANDRYFTFACGAGFDAEAATRVEERKASKQRFGETYFYLAATTVFVTSYFRRAPFLRVRTSQGEVEAVMAIGLNAGPYAYIIGRPVVLSEARDAGMDLFTLRRLRYRHLLAYGLGAMLTGQFGPEATASRDVGGYEVFADEPFAVHVDGEPIASTDHLAVSTTEQWIDVIV